MRVYSINDEPKLRRWFFHSSDDNKSYMKQGSVEVSWKYNFGYGLVFGRNGDESDVGLDIHLGPFSAWLRAKHPALKFFRSKDYDPRHTSFEIHPWQGCFVRVRLDSPDDFSGKHKREWSLSTYQVLGRTSYQTKVVEEGKTEVPMLEGNYPAVWQKVETTINHLRFPGTLTDRFKNTTRTDYRLDIPDGIPVEGKGENSWDCGMDGLFGCGGDTLEDAVGSAVSHVLRDRKRYGGPFNLTRATPVKELV